MSSKRDRSDEEKLTVEKLLNACDGQGGWNHGFLCVVFILSVTTG